MHTASENNRGLKVGWGHWVFVMALQLYGPMPGSDGLWLLLSKQFVQLPYIQLHLDTWILTSLFSPYAFYSIPCCRLVPLVHRRNKAWNCEFVCWLFFFAQSTTWISTWGRKCLRTEQAESCVDTSVLFLFTGFLPLLILKVVDSNFV